MNELAVNIQNADKTEPIATSQIEARWVFFPKRSQPNTQMPKNVDSKKKANNPSIASEGPTASATDLEQSDQYIPNSNSCKIPVTTPTARLIKSGTAKNFTIFLYISFFLMTYNVSMIAMVKAIPIETGT